METKGKRPQVKFDTDDNIRIENDIYNNSVESDAAFFASENIHATRQIDTIKMPTQQPRPRPMQQASSPPIPPQTRTSGKKLPQFPKKQNSAQKQQFKTEKPPMSDKMKKAVKERLKRKREQVRTFSHILGSVLLIVFILSVSAFLSQFIVRAFLDFTGITAAEYQVTIQIPPDSTTVEIAEILYSYDLVDMPGLFEFYSRISESDGNYLNGLFTLNSTMSYNQIITTLQNRPQSTETVEVKITEGMTALEIAMLLEENFVCRAEDFMQFYRNKMNLFNFERRLEHKPLKFNQLEGYLFPDTHEFFVVNGLEDNPDMDTERYADVAARTIFSHFNSQITAETYRRIGDLGDTFDFEFGLDEFITIASMVQLEASEPEDMRKVASVFFNRLRNPENFPRLESDVARENYGKDNILPFRTSDNTVLLNGMIAAYNTYESNAVHNGRLVSPPGPVCNPGMSAMLATLNAESTNYFYFCANIETGEVFFAETLVEHEANEIKAGIR
ncbi:MAG: endolytic transglycosylase MltG [Oscillospiraceae bacterium]|nr:endolytic transglycosylase MltG [Oscillospiraceae bacterium]